MKEWMKRARINSCLTKVTLQPSAVDLNDPAMREKQRDTVMSVCGPGNSENTTVSA